MTANPAASLSNNLLLPLWRDAACFALAFALLLGLSVDVKAAGQASQPNAFEVGVEAYRKGDFIKARASFKTACEAGDARACAVRGEMLAYGLGGAVDLHLARKDFDFACGGFIGIACRALGSMAYEGLGGGVDLPLARAAFGRACDGGEASGCYMLAGMLARGQGGATDVSGARNRYLAACHSNYEDACVLIEQWTQRACDEGDASGCTFLGEILSSGAGGAEDRTGARRLFQRGCDGGHSDGCYWLATMLEFGKGGEIDLPRARKLYQRSCDLTFGGRACLTLANMLIMGKGGAQDRSGGIGLTRNLCKAGNQDACGYLEQLGESH